MMPNITYGRRVRGLLEYLWGPGRAEEHTYPHVVAGYDDPDVLAPPRHPTDRTRWDLATLAARLNAPQEAAGDRGIHRHVWHCSLSLPPQEGPLDDAQWQAIARRFIEKMGFAGDADRPGCRWVAVRHGLSKGGNDHIHLVVTLATEGGAPVWLRQDKHRSQQVAEEIENEFGLIKLARRDARNRPGASRPELEHAERAGRPATDRETLRRQVRAALAGAASEAEWVSRMKASGLLVAPHTATGDPRQVVGYAVAMPPADRRGRPRWLAGRALDDDLSLTRIRRRWPAGEPLGAAGWKTLIPPESAPLPKATRTEAWRRSADALVDITARLAAVPPTSPQWPAAARASADLLSQIASIAEPAGGGPLSRAADSLARAAAPRRADPPPGASAVATELDQVARALLLAGRLRSPTDAAVFLVVVVQTARLIVALAQVRDAQDQAAAAGAARAAAAHLLPVMRHAHHPTSPAPAAAPPPARTNQTTTSARPDEHDTQR